MKRTWIEGIQAQQEELWSLSNFRAALKSTSTRSTYERLFSIFLAHAQMSPDAFAVRALEDRRWAEQLIMGFLKSQEQRLDRGEISRATLKLFVYPLKLFCAMNDIVINWTKIQKTLPAGNKVANDRRRRSLFS